MHHYDIQYKMNIYPLRIWCRLIDVKESQKQIMWLTVKTKEIKRMDFYDEYIVNLFLVFIFKVIFSKFCIKLYI